MAELSTTTQNDLAKKVMDVTLKGSFMTMKFLSNPKTWHGAKMEKTIQTSSPTNGGFFTGLTAFDITPQTTQNVLRFDCSFAYQSVVLAGTDIALNGSTPQRSAMLKANSMEESANALAERMGDALMGTGGANQPDGLRKIIDNGTVSATYGGLTRASVTQINSTRLSPGLGVAMTYDHLQTVETGSTVSSDVPTLHVTTKALWNRLSDLTPVQQQIQTSQVGYAQATRLGVVQSKQANGASVGYNALWYRGSPVVSDEKCPTGHWFMINEKYLEWYGLSDLGDPNMTSVRFGDGAEIEGVYEGMDSKNVGLHFTGLKDPVDKWGKIGQFIIAGNLISFNPNRHGVLIIT